VDVLLRFEVEGQVKSERPSQATWSKGVVEPLRGIAGISPADLGWRGQQVAHSDQVVGRQSEGEHPTDSGEAAMAGLAQAPDGLGLPSEQEYRVAPHIVPAVQPSEEHCRALFSSLGLDMNSRPVRAVFNMITTGIEGLGIINTREAHACACA
jgi:hypothetical protein